MADHRLFQRPGKRNRRGGSAAWRKWGADCQKSEDDLGACGTVSGAGHDPAPESSGKRKHAEAAEAVMEKRLEEIRKWKEISREADF